MGSPISGTLTEIYLQLIEEYNIKHWIENKDLFYYKRYVDDIFIIVDIRKTNHNTIINKLNKISSNLEFKITSENNNVINYLDMNIIRKPNAININIYIKPTNANITIHQKSNHPQCQKDAVYRH